VGRLLVNLSPKLVMTCAVLVVALAAPMALGQVRPGTQSRPETTTNVVQNQPHFGLNRESYGPLDAGFVITTFCDGTTAQGRQQVSGLTGPLGRLQRMLERNLPLENRELIQDRNIQTADLQHHFRTLVANHQYPNPDNTTRTYYTASIALVDRDPQNLVFWWVADFVNQEEVDAAANEFCQRQQMTAVPQGSSAICADPSVIQFNNAPLNVTRTYVLTAFSCAPAQ
jgi:hypothetical protein